MTRWKNTPQKKEQEAVLMARDLINMVISKMSDPEFRMMIIKVLAGLEKKHGDTRESLSGEITD